MDRLRCWDACDRLAPWVAGGLLATPIVAVRYPPMSDLAMHEALVSILRHHGDPAWAPPGLYRVVAPQANQLFHWLAFALSFVVPTDMACKLVVAASVFVAPPALARLLRHLGRSPWVALLVGPIMCGWTFRWGLAANLTGIALLLVMLPLLEGLAHRPSGRAIAGGVLAAAVLIFAHESSAVLFGLIVGVFALIRGRSLAGIARRASPALAVAALAALQWGVSQRLLGAGMRAVGTYFGPGVVERLLILPGAVFGGIGAARLAGVGCVWVAALVASVVARRRRGPAAEGGVVRGAAVSRVDGRTRDAMVTRALLWRWRYALLAAISFVFYLGSPTAVGGTTLIAHRFLPGVCVCLLVACASRRRSWAVVVLAVVSPLVVLAAEAKDFADADRSYRALDALIARVPMDVAVAQLDLTPRRASHLAPVPGAASRLQAERGGRMLFAMTDMPPNPVYVPAALQWNEPKRRLASSPFGFMPSYDFTRFAYLLVRDGSPRMRRLVVLALRPEADLVASAGQWALFRSRLHTVPLTAPDAPLPDPIPQPLADRINRLAAERASLR